MRSVIYSAFALAIMIGFFFAMFLSFENNLIERGYIASSAMGTIFVVAYIAVGLLLVSCVFIAFYRGLRMWCADTWESGDRILSGVELKMEVAVIIGLGITLASFLVRGLF
jgi:hypothetical protein